jgi:cyclase
MRLVGQVHITVPNKVITRDPSGWEKLKRALGGSVNVETDEVQNELEATAVIDAGADKVAVNSAALDTPALISQIARRYGSQAVVVAVDAKSSSDSPGKYEVWACGGRQRTGREVIAWVREAEDRGAGEVLLTSIDRDGTGDGFDCELTASVAVAVRIPVIASGGAGSAAHFVQVFEDGKADAALAASVFHYELNTLSGLKQELALAGLPVRWPC